MNRKLVSSIIAATTLFTSVLPAFAGEQQSWINGDTLAKDPRALCSDVGLGSNTQNNNGSSSSSSRTASAKNNSASGASSSSQSNNSTHNDGGGGSVSVLGLFSVGGNGGSKGSNSSSASNSSRYAQASASSQSSASSRANAFNRDSSTVVTGKNCDAFVGAAAARDIAHDDNITARYGIDAQVKINDSNNQTAVQLLNSQRRSGAVNNLTQWYSPQH
ncbi:MAG: hypothetical protein ACAF41_06205 [Leptolyngbya sp. BL-A-14]